MLNKVAQTIEQNALLSPGTKVLVGISGGADSLATAFCLKQLGFNVFGAFFDHGWRDVSAEKSLVEEFCLEQGITLFCGRAETDGPLTEENARNNRWAFLNSVASENDIPFIATGHNALDRLETAIMNLLRGCGVHGLVSMGHTAGKIVRPLLDCSVDEIRAFCIQNDLNFATDPTNCDLSYRRNLVRHQLKPLIDNINPAIQSLNNLTAECAQLDYMSDTRLSIWEREVNEEYLHGFKVMKLSVRHWKTNRWDDYTGIIFSALRKLRGTTHNISGEFVKRIVHLALYTPQGQATENDVACFTWKEHLYIILDFVDYPAWGPVACDRGRIVVNEIDSLILHPGPKGILRSYRNRKERKLCAKHEIPPFVRNRVAFFVADENPKESQILVGWNSVRRLP